MMIKKTLTILAVSCMMYSCATKTESNPFFTEFQTEYGVPSFDKIKLEHYEPAFLKGIEEQNQNIEAIIESTEIQTFENTIVALDNSAPILDRVSIIFFNMTDAETTDSLTALSIKLAPVLSEHNDNISLNGKLFKRVNDVYQKKDSLNLTSEQARPAAFASSAALWRNHSGNPARSSSLSTKSWKALFSFSTLLLKVMPSVESSLLISRRRVWSFSPRFAPERINLL